MLCVTPLAGVWIEIFPFAGTEIVDQSLPLRECGLKSYGIEILFYSVKVTPLAGVWIEIKWEILSDSDVFWSLPLRECGLKSVSMHRLVAVMGHSPCGSVD